MHVIKIFIIPQYDNSIQRVFFDWLLAVMCPRDKTPNPLRNRKHFPVTLQARYSICLHTPSQL